MSQVTIYLDKETERQLERIVREKKISKSKWIADLIREKTASEWPEYIISLSGVWQDFPTMDKIRESSGEDIKREIF